MMNLWLILVALIVPLMGATADPLARQADLRDGTIIFSYPGPEGMTGNADSIRLVQDPQGRSRTYFRGILDDRDQYHEGDVLATLEVRRGRVREIGFGVWGPASPRPSADRDLGRLEPAAAVDLLFGVIETGEQEAAQDAVFGAAIVPDDRALPRLFGLARDREAAGEVREQGLFWLAILAGHEAAGTLQAVIDAEDEDLELREHAVFALTQLGEERAFPLLMQIARSHPNADVRSSSFLWLARYDRPEVVNLFEEILVGE